MSSCDSICKACKNSGHIKWRPQNRGLCEGMWCLKFNRPIYNEITQCNSYAKMEAL